MGTIQGTDNGLKILTETAARLADLQNHCSTLTAADKNPTTFDSECNAVPTKHPKPLDSRTLDFKSFVQRAFHQSNNRTKFEGLTTTERKHAHEVATNGYKGYIAKPTSTDASARKRMLNTLHQSNTAEGLVKRVTAVGVKVVVADVKIDAGGIYNTRHNVIAVDNKAAKDPKMAVAVLSHEAMHAVDDQMNFRSRIQQELKERGKSSKLASIASEAIAFSAEAKASAEMNISFTNGKPLKSMEDALNYVISSKYYQDYYKFKPSDFSAADKRLLLGLIKSAAREFPTGMLPFKSSVTAVPLPKYEDVDHSIKTTVGGNKTEAGKLAMFATSH